MQAISYNTIICVFKRQIICYLQFQKCTVLKQKKKQPFLKCMWIHFLIMSSHSHNDLQFYHVV